MSTVCLSLLLDLAFISKVHKPLPEQRFKETQTKSTEEEESISSISENTGNNITDIL